MLSINSGCRLARAARATVMLFKSAYCKNVHLLVANYTMNKPQRPIDWTDEMTHFIQALIPEGEETESATILFETEYSHMAGKYGSDWFKMLRNSASHSIVSAAFGLTHGQQATSSSLSLSSQDLRVSIPLPGTVISSHKTTLTNTSVLNSRLYR